MHLSFLLLVAMAASAASENVRDYCVVGAGPAGEDNINTL